MGRVCHRGSSRRPRAPEAAGPDRARILRVSRRYLADETEHLLIELGQERVRRFPECLLQGVAEGAAMDAVDRENVVGMLDSVGVLDHGDTGHLGVLTILVPRHTGPTEVARAGRGRKAPDAAAVAAGGSQIWGFRQGGAVVVFGLAKE